MVILIWTLSKGSLHEFIFGTDKGEVAPVCLQPLFKYEETAVLHTDGGHFFYLGVYVDEDVVRGIIKRIDKALEDLKLIMGKYQICVFHKAAGLLS